MCWRKPLNTSFLQNCIRNPPGKAPPLCYSHGLTTVLHKCTVRHYNPVLYSATMFFVSEAADNSVPVPATLPSVSRRCVADILGETRNTRNKHVKCKMAEKCKTWWPWGCYDEKVTCIRQVDTKNGGSRNKREYSDSRCVTKPVCTLLQDVFILKMTIT